MADKSKTFGAVDASGNPLPVVWDTYKQDYEVFRPNDPSWTLTDADWNKWGPAPPGCPSAPAGTPVLRMTAKAPPALARAVTSAARSNGLLGDDVNEAFTGPLVDQAASVRYQILEQYRFRPDVAALLQAGSRHSIWSSRQQDPPCSDRRHRVSALRF